jgi:hypothetical protein
VLTKTIARSDMDTIPEDELWSPQVLHGLQGLYAWGPPPPPSFLEPADLAALMTDAHSARNSQCPTRPIWCPARPARVKCANPGTVSSRNTLDGKTAMRCSAFRQFVGRLAPSRAGLT